MTDVVVVGGGLAGLSCALHLAQRGLQPTVLEASDGVGGRVRTDVVDGFRLDRGFQVYLTAYREGRRVLDLDALDLRHFEPGALVWAEGAFHRVTDPLRRPGGAWSSFRAPVGTAADKLRIARLASRLRDGDPARFLEQGGGRTAADVLADAGLSGDIVERLVRPLFAGISLDRDLGAPAGMFEFVWGALAGGNAAVPASGMQAIPDQLAARLPEGSVRLAAPVARVDAGGVVLSDGERIAARAVVIATQGPEASRLTGLPDPGSRSVTGVWFAADEPPLRGPYIALDSQMAPATNLAVMSEVAPTYAPSGRALVAVQALGNDAEVAASVRNRMRELFGGPVDGWEMIATQRIAHGHPARYGVGDPRIGRARYVAGDHRHSPSIEGALRSGRAAADAVAGDLAGGTGDTPPLH
jgi:phytoene dehydrogenase-like protein